MNAELDECRARFRSMSTAEYDAFLTTEFAKAKPGRFKVLSAAEFTADCDAVESAVVVHIDPKVARFTPRRPSEFTSGPPMEWLVRGVLPRAALAVVYGDSGSGKTFFTLDLVSCIARAVQWRDAQTRAGRVVYVCAEGASGFRKRLTAYAQAHGVGIDSLPWVVADAPNFLTQDDPVALAKGIGTADVVVIDTLSAVTPGGNENSGEDMGAVLNHCKSIHRHTGALVVLIHHSGKDATKGARGWSGIRAAADAEIEVTRKGDARTAKVTKLKDGGDFQKYGFRLRVVELGLSDGQPETSCVVEHVAGVIAETPQAPSGEIETAAYNAVTSGITSLHNAITAALKERGIKKPTKHQRQNMLRRGFEPLDDKGLITLDLEAEPRTCGLPADSWHDA